MTDSERSDNPEDDVLHELRMALGAGAADAIGAITSDVAVAIGWVTLASARAARALRDAGLEDRLVAGMVVGASLEGLF